MRRLEIAGRAAVFAVLFPALLSVAARAAGRPEYPLYSPFFGSSHQFTADDLKAIAANFDFIYGQTLSKDEMEAARHMNPKLQFIKYVGAWTVRADEAERSLRRQILYYTCGALAEDIDPRRTEFRLSGSSPLKGSTIPGEYSRSLAEYVTWIRIDGELMRLESVDAAQGRVRVTRKFASERAEAHRKGAQVFSPVYGVAPGKPNEWEGKGSVSYHYDPSFPARWNHIYDTLERFISEGGDGIWIDILMDRSLRESDVEGKELGRPSWNFASGRPYTRDEFRRRNEAGVRSIQERFKRKFGRDPVIYANNMMASRYEEGQGGHKFYLLSTAQKPRPVNGMCIEDFMGGYESAEWAQWTKSRTPSVPKKACYPCTAGYKNWIENVKMLMKSAQAGLPAVPLMINAGMKTAIFEAIDRRARHEWELWAYASYLLGVEKKNGACPTKLGVPMFYRDGDKRHVALDPMYYWRIGEPADSVRAEEIARYRIGTGDVYRRRFSNGLVLVNPGPRAAQVRLDERLIDPETGERITTVTLAPQSGKILLKD